MSEKEVWVQFAAALLGSDHWPTALAEWEGDARARASSDAVRKARVALYARVADMMLMQCKERYE